MRSGPSWNAAMKVCVRLRERERERERERAARQYKAMDARQPSPSSIHFCTRLNQTQRVPNPLPRGSEHGPVRQVHCTMVGARGEGRSIRCVTSADLPASFFIDASFISPCSPSCWACCSYLPSSSSRRETLRASSPPPPSHPTPKL